MFYLTTHSTHFIYSYMASGIWLGTILIVREETCCRHIGSYRLTARVLLYAPSHRQDNTYHGLCYTSRGALKFTDVINIHKWLNKCCAPSECITAPNFEKGITVMVGKDQTETTFATRSSSFHHYQQREREMFYLTTHSTHFIYGYMASDIWLRTILIVRKETRCRHIGYSFRLAARILLYAPSHRQDNTYHGLGYTSRGALAVMRNSSMGPPYEGSIRRPTAS